MKLLTIGVSLATLSIAIVPAQAGRYLVDQCSPNRNQENWFLIFDTQEGIVNFSSSGSDSPRYGIYSTVDGAAYMNVANDTAAPMNMKLRNNHDPAGKPVLEWTSGTETSTMLCDFLYERDTTPANWVVPPNAQSPAIADTAPTYRPPEPDLKTTTPPTTTSGLTIALSSDGIGGHTVDATLGTSTPTTMLIDTGATIVSLPQNIADQLISIGEATLVDKGQFTIADGTTHIKNIIDIGKFTIGGRTLYHIRASVAPDGAEPLLGTNVLNIFGKFSIDAANNQLILG